MASVIALALAMPPVGAWPLGGFALVPWLVVAGRSRPLSAACGGLLVGTAFGCVTAAWIPQAVT